MTEQLAHHFYFIIGAYPYKTVFMTMQLKFHKNHEINLYRRMSYKLWLVYFSPLQARRKQFSIGRVFGKSIFMSGTAANGRAPQARSKQAPQA